MPTVQEFVSDALADVGAVKPGQTPTGNTAQFAIRKHREMVRSWSANRLRLSFVPEVTYTLAPNKGSYQIGPGAADFDTTPGVFVKPVFLQAACVIVGTARRWPLNILTRPQWDLNLNRNLDDPDGPLDLFYDFNTPIATLNIGPVPTQAQNMLVSQWNPLRGFVPGEEQLNLEDFYPEEYLKPMRIGLAIELAPSYRFTVTQDLANLFQESIGIVERMNNDKLSGAFGVSRTLSGPVKGDGQPVQGQ